MGQFELSADSVGLTAEDLGQKTWRAVLAEFIAVALFLFVGCGAIVTITGVLGGAGSPNEGITPANDPAALVAVAFSFGVALVVLIGATTAISGGHLNPAVTFALVITGKTKLTVGVIYVAAQLLGAVVGVFLLDLVVVNSVSDPSHLGATTLNGAALESTGAAVVVEAILTFVLVFTVFATAIDKRGLGHVAPLAIGLAVFIDHFVGVPLTGASMNPARSFGPALVSGTWDDQWVYWIGPLIGAGIAGLLYYLVYLTHGDEEAAAQEPARA
jgi:MIP family channel proteins